MEVCVPAMRLPVFQLVRVHRLDTWADGIAQATSCECNAVIRGAFSSIVWVLLTQVLSHRGLNTSFLRVSAHGAPRIDVLSRVQMFLPRINALTHLNVLNYASMLLPACLDARTGVILCGRGPNGAARNSGRGPAPSTSTPIIDPWLL